MSTATLNGWVESSKEQIFGSCIGGRWYKGLVQRVGWNRTKGYGATVVYEDGYIEIVPVATLVTLHQREEFSNAQKLRQQVESTSESQCQGTKSKGGSMAVTRATSQNENGRLDKLQGTYLGQRVLKWFLNARGVGERFAGVVKEVWDNDGVFMAQIVYEDGDQVDMRIEELEHLLQQGEAPPGFDNNRAKPSNELQWPIFEVTEADLVAFWEYHIASLQENGSKDTEAGADNSPSVKPDKLKAGVDYEVFAEKFSVCDKPKQGFNRGMSARPASLTEECSEFGVCFLNYTKYFRLLFDVLISFAMMWLYVEQKLNIRREPPW